MNPSLIALALALAGIALFGFILERHNWTARKLSIIVALSTLAALGRVGLAAIPGAQPTTFLVSITGYVFGPLLGLLTGTATAFVSNIFLGHGPWTVWQMLAWGLCGLSAGFLRVLMPETRMHALVLFGIFWGFLFGWITNIPYTFPLAWETWMALNIASLGMDALHAASNAFFLLLAGKPFIKILKEYAAKMQTKSLG